MDSVEVQIARLMTMVESGQRVSAERHAENVSRLDEIKLQQKTTNGRLTQAEKAIAVLKFAVFTIGGALLIAALQVAVARFTAGQ